MSQADRPITRAPQDGFDPADGRHYRFTDRQLEVIRFCAIECEMQQSGEQSVWWMLNAWEYAYGRTWDDPFTLPTVDDVLTLGALVEPNKNDRGFRQVGVRVGWDVKGDWRDVPRQVEQLCSDDAYEATTPGEWFRQYEEIHPFRDGNGRTGQILYNWLNDTLQVPVWAPNYWDDARRMKGYGA